MWPLAFASTEISPQDEEEISAMVKKAKLAELIHRKNQVDNEIAALVDRPAQPDHAGALIASPILGPNHD